MAAETPKMDDTTLSTLPTREREKVAVGKTIYRRMLDKGMTQSDLARRTGIGRDSISTYVNGRSLPTPQNLALLAQALGCETADLRPTLAAPPPFTFVSNASDPSVGQLVVNMAVRMDVMPELLALLGRAQPGQPASKPEEAAAPRRGRGRGNG